MYLFLLFSFFNPWLPSLDTSQVIDNQTSIIVFSQVTDTFFIKNTLPQLTRFAQENNLQFVQKDAAIGAPENITTTPAIVLQNWRGRSIYANRYTEFSTIKNFIRTSRVVPQQTAKDCREDIAVWQSGRTTIAAPIKVTPLQGTLPKGFHQQDFTLQIKSLLTQQMTDFSLQVQSCLGKTDRLFYLDIHPYRTANDDFFLSIEIYSQFNCKKPIFSQMRTPLKGTFSDWQTVVVDAAKRLEQEIRYQITSSTIGDAFSPLPLNIPTKTWNTLGLTLPQPTDNQLFENTQAIKMPTQWTYANGIDPATPIVQFRFMAPLDRYIGEIKTITGDLSFSTTQQTMSGDFTAAMQSLTMGSEDFDYNVLNKYIKAYKIPESRFAFASSGNLPELQFGETVNLTVIGTFTLMRKKRPVQVTAQLTPIIDQNGKPLLQVSAAFSLNVVDDFGIKGPDGPAPARKTMLFDLNFMMIATE